MREILFRGKRVGNEQWVYGYYANCSNGNKFQTRHYIIEYPDRYHEIYTSSVGQYTGLKDKNGKKIFEGDIVIEELGAIKTGVVTFGNHGVIDEVNPDSVGFYVKWIDDDNLRIELYYWHDKVEIVGNIHDNPELLKEV